MAAFLLGGRPAAELLGEVGAYRNQCLWLVVDMSTDRYKPPLEKTVVIKLDYLVDRGVPGLSSKNERNSNGDRSCRFRYQRQIAAPSSEPRKE